jgi:hypothetical protein
VAAGCGTAPLAPPDPSTVRAPGRSTELRDPRTRLRFAAPINWTKRFRHDPGIVRISSGDAEVSGWAYPRSEPLPKTRPQLQAALTALVQLAKQRNPSFSLSAGRITRVHGTPAIELRGTQRIFGRVISTRSVHIYRRLGEYVFEALAPSRDFGVADKQVLEPLLRSLDFSRVAAV